MGTVTMWGRFWVIMIGLAVVLATAPAVSAVSQLVDANAATQAELEKLPGIGEATAKKIIAGRPYASMDDLTKKLTEAKVSKATLAKITPLLAVGGVAARSAVQNAPAKAGAPVPATGQAPATAKGSEPVKSTAAATVAQTPPQKGMVWVNTETKVFHKEGDRWYGKTKHGKWMTEADALKEGYRAAKN